MLKTKLLKAAVITTLILNCFSGFAFADNSLTLPQAGLKLQGKAKQEYIVDYFAGYDQRESQPFVLPSDWSKNEVVYDNFVTEHYTKRNVAHNRAILYLHGGGYVIKASNSHRRLSLQQAELFGAGEVFIPDYRLAPKHVYPAALEDAAKTYELVLERGFDAEQVIFVGDSAGGNLAVALALYAKENEMPQPGAIILVSPWSTLENKKKTSRYYNLHKDLSLGEGTLLYPDVLKAEFKGRLKPKNPLVSPIYSDLSGLAPMLIQAGGNEIFLTECQDLAARAAKCGVDVTLTVYPEMPHDFSLLLPEMQESINSLKEMRDFVERYAK